jgi:hypothetical protein
MNYETAIALAHQRMCEIGKQHCKDYHIEPVSIVGTEAERKAGEITIRAYNEYFFLVNYEKYYGLRIFSDASYFEADDYTYNTIPQEFTGLIKIIRIPSKAWSIDGTGGMLPLLTANQRMIPVDFIKVTIH